MASDSIEPPLCEGGSCQLFGLFGIAVQCFIGVWCVFTLFVIWRCENVEVRRNFCTWMGDMSKQMLGAGWGHFMNVFFAIIFGEAVEESAFSNQCIWYLVGFLSDILIVTMLCWLVVSTLRPHIRKHCGIDIGEYESGGGNTAPSREEEIFEPEKEEEGSGIPFWMMWCAQVVIWVAILSVVKSTVFYVAYLAQDWIYTGIDAFFVWLNLCGHPRRQLLSSVIIIPVIGDAFQFIIQDNFLKKRTESDGSKSDGSASDDNEDGMFFKDKLSYQEFQKLAPE